MVKEIRINLYSFLIKHNYKAPRTMNVMSFRKDLHSFVRGLTLSVDYHCYPIGTEHDWKKRCDVIDHNGFKLYTRTNELDFTELVERYNPSESVLNLYTQMVESLQIVNL